MKKFIFYLIAALSSIFLSIYCLHQKRFFAYHLATKADRLIESNFFYPQLKIIESSKDVLVSYLFGYKNDIENSTLPKYYVTLTDDVIEYLKPFEKVEKYPEIPKDYQTAQLSYNDNQCNIKLKLHGGWYGHDTLVPLSPHHQEAKKSYSVKITNGELHDVKEWSFIIPSDRFFISSLFVNQVYNRLGLPYPKSHFGILYINDLYQGIYYIEEDIDESKEYHSRNKLKNHITLKTTCDSCLMFIPGKNNFKPLDFTTTISDSILLQKIQNQLDSLMANINDTTIDRYFDLNKTAKLLSTIYLRGDFGVHDITERNLRLTYDINNSKFFITPRVESGIAELTCNYIDENKNCLFDKELCHFRYYPYYHKLLYHLLKNETIINKMNHYLDDLILDDNLITIYTQLQDSLGALLSKDITLNSHLKLTEEVLKVQGNSLENNIEKLRNR